MGGLAGSWKLAGSKVRLVDGSQRQYDGHVRIVDEAIDTCPASLRCIKQRMGIGQAKEVTLRGQCDASCRLNLPDNGLRGFGISDMVDRFPTAVLRESQSDRAAEVTRRRRSQSLRVQPWSAPFSLSMCAS